MIKYDKSWCVLGFNAFFGGYYLWYRKYPSDSKEMLITYSEQHQDVWDKLSKEQCGGKYSSYKYDTLPRGRVWYDTEEKKY